MTEISEWLRGLGLERYQQAFDQNDIDLEVLPSLTSDDLVELGITSIGHRRKLLAALRHCARRRRFPIRRVRRGPPPRAPPQHQLTMPSAAS